MRRFGVVGIVLIVAVVAAAALFVRPTLARLTPPDERRPVEVRVTLSDMKIAASTAAFDVGVPYHFVITNTGQASHELMIMPRMGNGAMPMAQMDKMALAMIDEHDLPPGAIQTLDYTFTQSAPQGTLEFACHVPGHYEAGMQLPITVR